MAEGLRKVHGGLLVVAVLCAGAAMTFTYFFLKAQALREERLEPVEVLVAARDLEAMSTIDADQDLRPLAVPPTMQALIQSSLTPDLRPTLDGRRVNRTVLAGSPLLYADLVPAVELELRGADRAISVAVRGAGAVSGLVAPGDMVKLVVTSPVRDPDGPSPVSTEEALAAMALEMNRGPTRFESTLVLSEPLRVLAVGQELSRSRFQMGAVEENAFADYTTVTLEVNEAQALTILERTGAGELPLTLMLCPRPVTTELGVAGP